MKYKSLLIAALSFYFCVNANISFSQEEIGYNVTGTIIDSVSQQALEFATVKFVPYSSSNITTISDKNGMFLFKNVSGNFNLLTTRAGYREEKIIYEESLPGSDTINLGNIYLTSISNTLQNVSVTATKPLIKREIDKIIYNIDADPESKSKSVLETMRKVPYLSFDAQGNLLLKGSQGFKILINGKPSGMMENNAMEVLKSMPASTIQSVEVYTTPPAKYDAEGLAGIVNIVTTKKIATGYKGSINIYENAPVSGPGAGFSFTSGKKKISFEAYGGGTLNSTPQTHYNSSRETFGTTPTTLNLDGSRFSKGRNGYIGTQLSYEIDSLNLLVMQFNLNGNKSDGTHYQNSVLQQNYMLQQFSLRDDSHNKSNGFDAGINYQLGFRKDKSKLLTASYKYLNYSITGQSNVDLFNKVNYLKEDFIQDNNNSSSEQTIQVDYIQTVKKLNIEAGVKSIFRENKSSFNTALFEPVVGFFTNVDSLDDKFVNHQNILAAYNSYSFSTKSWAFKAGLRFEQTFTNVDFQSTKSKVRQNYFNIVPSLVINKDLGNHKYLNFGFNQRLKRPGIKRLNPFIDKSNPNYEESGNPNLKPVLLNNFQLGFGSNKKQSINLSLDYSFGRNMDLKITNFDTLTRITKTTYQNNGDISMLGFNYNLNLSLIENLKTVLNGNFSNFWLEGTVDNSSKRFQRLIYYASLSNSYNFRNGWRANANLDVVSKSIVQLQGVANDFMSTAFSISKNLMKDKLALSAYINNPFTWLRNRRTEISWANFTEINNSHEYFRKFGISLNYQFGNQKKSIITNKRGINNNDVAN